MDSKQSLVWVSRNSGQCNVEKWPILGLMWTVKWKWKESNLFFQSHCVQAVQIESTTLRENPMNEMAVFPCIELSSCIKIYSNGQSHHLATLVFVFYCPFMVHWKLYVSAFTVAWTYEREEPRETILQLTGTEDDPNVQMYLQRKWNWSDYLPGDWNRLEELHTSFLQCKWT